MVLTPWASRLELKVMYAEAAKLKRLASWKLAPLRLKSRQCKLIEGLTHVGFHQWRPPYGNVAKLLAELFVFAFNEHFEIAGLANAISFCIPFAKRLTGNDVILDLPQSVLESFDQLIRSFKLIEVESRCEQFHTVTQVFALDSEAMQCCEILGGEIG